MNERDWQSRVAGHAARRGRRARHARPARDGRGERATPIQGHTGFPDLVMARRGRIALAELRSDTGRLTAGQRDWLAALPSLTAVAEAHVWRPKDRPEARVALR